MGWLSKAGKYRVEHVPCPNPGLPVDESAPAVGVMHTVEGSLESGLGVFRRHYAPHFLVGPGRILQLVPLGTMAGALEHTGPPPTNGWARVQIEVAGHSHQTRWLPDPKTLDALAALLATLHVVEGIPLLRPYPNWMPGGEWATTSFVRRRDGKWGHTSGWFGHVEVPNNSHWDPGYLDWTALMGLSKVKLMPKPPVVKPKPRPMWIQVKTAVTVQKAKRAPAPSGRTATTPKAL